MTPTIFDLDIKMIDWKLNIEARKLQITNHEAVVGAFLQFKELQDQVLLKQDGFPTYHLASVVDDHLFVAASGCHVSLEDRPNL